MIENPTIKELKESISNDLRSRLNISDDKLKKVLDAMASVLAAQFKLTYLALNDVQRNLYPDTADTSENGGMLDRLGRIYLNRDIRPATSAIYEVQVTGQVGSTLRSGLTFKSNDDARNAGKLFVLDNEFTLANQTETINIRSLGGGSEFELEIGNELTITEPVIGVSQTIEVTGVDTEPVEAESVENYRAAILRAIQLEPQGGSRTDYRIWASDASGVRFVYPFVKDNEPGTVQVFVEANSDDSTDGNGTPSQAILDDVEDVIKLDPDSTKPISERGRIPIQANLEVLPIETLPVDVEIINLQNDTSAIRQAIESNLINYLSTIRPFVDGADLLRNRNDVLFAARLSSTASDVLEAGNFFQSFNMIVDGTNVINFLFEKEKIPYLRNVTYIS